MLAITDGDDDYNPTSSYTEKTTWLSTGLNVKFKNKMRLWSEGRMTWSSWEMEACLGQDRLFGSVVGKAVRRSESAGD